MSKYEPLSEFLGRLQADYWRPTFLELERILDFKLPASARKNAAWWEQAPGGRSGHAQAWGGAGWRVDSVDVDKQRVTFVRGEGAAPDNSTDADTESLTRRLRERAAQLGDWASDGREAALGAVRERPFAAAGVSAGVAFAAGVGLGYLLLRAVTAPAEEEPQTIEDRAYDALETISGRVHDLVDGLADRVRSFRP